MKLMGSQRGVIYYMLFVEIDSKYTIICFKDIFEVVAPSLENSACKNIKVDWEITKNSAKIIPRAIKVRVQWNQYAW